MQRVVLEREDLPAGCEVDLAGIPLPERVKLLTGATSWTLHPMPAVGLRSITMSDGPIGVRGIDDGLGHSAQLPNPSAVAATWDRDLIGRLGALVAAEARRKGAHVVLAPVVNLQRTPVGGRHFECYSEDPFLTGWVAAAYIQAVQAFGVGACVKHFVGNESETAPTHGQRTATGPNDHNSARITKLEPEPFIWHLLCTLTGTIFEPQYWVAA